MNNEKHNIDWYSGYLQKMNEEMEEACGRYDEIITETKMDIHKNRIVMNMGLGITALLLLLILLSQLLR